MNAKAEKELDSLRALKRPPTADELTECLKSLRTVDATDYARVIRSLARVVAELRRQQASKCGPVERLARRQRGRMYKPEDVAEAVRTFFLRSNTEAELKKREGVKRNRPQTRKGFENLDPIKRVIQLPERSDVVRAILKGRNLKPPLRGSNLMAAATKHLDYDLNACGTDWDTILERVAIKWFEDRFPA